MVQGAVPPGTDVNMLVLTGGRERTEGEYRGLLGAAGWRLERVLPTGSISSIFEPPGVRAPAGVKGAYAVASCWA